MVEFYRPEMSGTREWTAGLIKDILASCSSHLSEQLHPLENGSSELHPKEQVQYVSIWLWIPRSQVLVFLEE